MMRFSLSHAPARRTAERQQPAQREHEQEVPKLSDGEEQLLSAISSSGRFTLAKAQGRYAGVKRRADK
jgi:hypothetical protein